MSSRRSPSTSSRSSSSTGWGLALACVLGALLGVALVSLASGGAVAEESNETAVSGAIADIDSDVRVLDYRYSEESEAFAIELENTGEESVQVQIMEIMDLSEDRDAPLGMQQLTIGGGETVEVGVSAQLNNREAGAVIMTEESLASGEVFPITYSEELPSFFEGSSSWSDVWAGSLAAIAFGILGLVVGMWEVVASKNEDVTEVPIQ